MKKSITIISIFINILLITFIYLLHYHGNGKSCGDYPIYNKILYTNLLNDFKSGDLLLFSNTRCNMITRTIGNPYFSHIGIIINISNELYSLELVYKDLIYPKQPRKQNIIIEPLYDRIKNYSGYVFYCKLMNNISIENENKLFEISKKEIKFSLLNNCGYFIAKILEDINIAKNITTWKFWNIHNNIINLCNDTIYASPILIISDNLFIQNINDNKLINYC